MGMFDSITYEKGIKCTCGKVLTEFQSKDLACCCELYVITKRGRMREGWKRLIGNTNKRWKGFRYIKDIGLGFYTDCSRCGRWHESYAIFMNGHLEKLTHKVRKI